MSKKILIPYFLGGLGHLTLAQSIAYFLNRIKPDWEIRLFDPADELKDQALNGLYKELWKKFLSRPKTARFLFNFDKYFPAVGSYINFQGLRSAIPKVMGFLSGYRPDLIMSTHWGGTQLFNLARTELSFEVPLLYIFGELGGKYRLINCGADTYFTISDKASRSLVELGIPSQKIVPINLVVNPVFSRLDIPTPEARARLGIRPEPFTILLSLGGEGIGFSRELLSRFVEEVDDMQMLILTGRNEGLFNEITMNFNHGKIVAFGYREDIDLIMASADMLAGKPGCSFTMEAVKMGKPLAVTRIGAPNELPNMNYIVENGYGWYTPKADQFTSLLNQIQSNPTLYTNALEKLSKVPKKNGAEEIAEYIAGHLE